MYSGSVERVESSVGQCRKGLEVKAGQNGQNGGLGGQYMPILGNGTSGPDNPDRNYGGKTHNIR